MNRLTPPIETAPVAAVSARQRSNAGIAKVKAQPIHPENKTGLLGLPTELLIKITHCVQRHGPFETDSLLATSRLLQPMALVPDVKSIHRLQRCIAMAATDLVDSILADRRYPVDTCAHALGSISDGLRGKVVNKALAITQKVDSARAISALVSDLDHLNASERRSVANRSIKASAAETDDYDKFRFIQPLMWKLHLFEPADQDLLISTMAGFTDEFKAQSIGGMTISAAHLTGDRLDEIARLALPISDRYHLALAISGLGAGMMSLSRDLLTRIFDITVAEAGAMPMAFAGLASGLKGLSEVQCDQLVDAALAIEQDMFKAVAIGGLGLGLDDLSGTRRSELLRAALALHGWEQSECLKGFSRGACHLSESDRNSLFDASVKLALEYIETDPIVNLASAVKHLGVSQRNDLVSLAISLSQDANVPNGDALMILGKQFAHLSLLHQAQIFRAASDIRNGTERAKAIAGLATSLIHLDEGQRTHLVEAATELPVLADKARVLGQLMAGARALALHEEARV
jgi:hypothetical protein